MLREKEKFFKYLFITSDLTVAILSFQVGIFLRSFFPFGGEFSGYNPLYYNLFSIIGGITQVWVFRISKFYHTRRGEKFAREVWEILQGVVLNFIILIVVLFFFREYSYSRLVFLYSFFISIINLIFLHKSLRSLLEYLRSKGKNLRHIIIVGQHHLGFELAEKILSSPEMGYRIYGIVEKDRKGKLLVSETKDSSEYKEYTRQKQARLKLLQKKIPSLSWKKFENYLRSWKVDAVILAMPPTMEETIFYLINLCQRENIDLRIIPTEIGLLSLPWNIENFFDFPIINFGKTPLDSSGARNVKRLFDISFSLVFCILNVPLFILIALIIKLTSKGPVFFIQERLGMDNRSFNMIKFRTMKVQEKTQSDTSWTMENDPRRSGIGEFLRKFNIDELPQFINVLLGQMSVVGPRPERPYFVKKFKEEIPGYMTRHKAKSGITGWAQVNGFRGDTSIEKRIEADLWYIENWTLWLDLKIIILTLFRSFGDKGAY